MKIQQVVVDNLTEEQAQELHELFDSGDVDAIEAKLQEFGVELPEGAGIARIERMERPKKRRGPPPDHVITIADSLAKARQFDLLTEFLDVNACMVRDLPLDPKRLVKLMADLMLFSVPASKA